MGFTYFRYSLVVSLLTAVLICFSIAAKAQSGASSGRDVIVYYSNETSPEGDELENYNILVSWLQDSGTDKANRIAKSLRKDQVEFSATVSKEITSISSANALVYVFTNRLMRKRQYQVKNGDAGLLTLPVPVLVPSTDNLVLENNPLSIPEVFSAVLNWVAAEINKFGLGHIGMIVKSHGNHKMALTPRVSIWAKSISKSELERKVSDEDGSQFISRPGITREDFFKAISDFQMTVDRPIDFLVLESCGSSPEIREYNLGLQIKSFFSNSSGKADYSSINYEQALRGASGSPVAALFQHLRNNPKFREFKSVSWFTQWLRVGLYFLPLLFLLFYWAWTRKKRRRIKV